MSAPSTRERRPLEDWEGLTGASRKSDWDRLSSLTSKGLTVGGVLQAGDQNNEMKTSAAIGVYARFRAPLL